MSATVRFADGAVIHRSSHDADDVVSARGEALAVARRVVSEFGDETPLLLESSLMPHGSVREVYRVPGEGVLRVEVFGDHGSEVA